MVQTASESTIDRKMGGVAIGKVELAFLFNKNGQDVEVKARLK